MSMEQRVQCSQGDHIKKEHLQLQKKDPAEVKVSERLEGLALDAGGGQREERWEEGAV